jgi:hypothetical protein
MVTIGGTVETMIDAPLRGIRTRIRAAIPIAIQTVTGTDVRLNACRSITGTTTGTTPAERMPDATVAMTSVATATIARPVVAMTHVMVHALNTATSIAKAFELGTTTGTTTGHRSAAAGAFRGRFSFKTPELKPASNELAFWLRGDETCRSTRACLVIAKRFQPASTGIRSRRFPSPACEGGLYGITACLHSQEHDLVRLHVWRHCWQAHIENSTPAISFNRIRAPVASDDSGWLPCRKSQSESDGNRDGEDYWDRKKEFP